MAKKKCYGHNNQGDKFLRSRSSSSRSAYSVWLFGFNSTVSTGKPYLGSTLRPAKYPTSCLDLTVLRALKIWSEGRLCSCSEVRMSSSTIAHAQTHHWLVPRLRSPNQEVPVPSPNPPDPRHHGAHQGNTAQSFTQFIWPLGAPYFYVAFFAVLAISAYCYITKHESKKLLISTPFLCQT